MAKNLRACSKSVPIAKRQSDEHASWMVKPGGHRLQRRLPALLRVPNPAIIIPCCPPLRVCHIQVFRNRYADEMLMSQALLNNPRFRPPAEADSLILQIDQGCPYNRCTFCGMYQGVKHQRRSPAEIRQLITAEARQASDTRRVFLADGDVMRRPFEELQLILTELAAHFPGLARVNAYTTGSAIATKTDAQLQALRALSNCTPSIWVWRAAMKRSCGVSGRMGRPRAWWRPVGELNKLAYGSPL